MTSYQADTADRQGGHALDVVADEVLHSGHVEDVEDDFTLTIVLKVNRKRLVKNDVTQNDYQKVMPDRFQNDAVYKPPLMQNYQFSRKS